MPNIENKGRSHDGEKKNLRHSTVNVQFYFGVLCAGKIRLRKCNRDTARDRDVDLRQNLPNIFSRKEEDGNWTAKKILVRRPLEVYLLDDRSDDH